MEHEKVVVVGLGEIGKPLLRILSRAYDTLGVDISEVELDWPCSILQICIPFELPNFLGICAEYIAKYKPRYGVINSTVAPGTTRALEVHSGIPIAYSPVRGKHVRMEADMLRYKKFVGAADESTVNAIVEHFERAGLATGRFRSPEAGELAKLLETTWLGVLVSWAQEAEHIADLYDLSYDDVDSYIQEIDFLPRVSPGYIGGHCVMPNIAILRSLIQSSYLDEIVKSNNRKAERMETAGTPPERNVRALAAIAHSARVGGNG